MTLELNNIFPLCVFRFVSISNTSRIDPRWSLWGFLMVGVRGALACNGFQGV